MKRVIKFETNKYMNKEHIQEIIEFAENEPLRGERVGVMYNTYHASYELVVTDFKVVVEDIYFWTPEERAEIWGE